MNWSQQATIIAKDILKKRGHDGTLTLQYEDAVELLSCAVMEGFRYECDNWVKKRK